MIKLVAVKLQILVRIRLIGFVYRFGRIAFHLSEGGRDDLVMRGRFGDCILEADLTRLVSVF